MNRSFLKFLQFQKNLMYHWFHCYRSDLGRLVDLGSLADLGLPVDR
jgi:hypothetical protein